MCEREQCFPSIAAHGGKGNRSAGKLPRFLCGTVYSYGEITKAYGYTVDVAGKSYMANGTSYDLALLEAGDVRQTRRVWS